LGKSEMDETQKPQKVRKRRFLRTAIRADASRSRHCKWRGVVKITTLIVLLLALAMGTGAAMIASAHKEPVLLACGGPNC
jgi:hypothetical protein